MPWDYARLEAARLEREARPVLGRRAQERRNRGNDRRLGQSPEAVRAGSWAVEGVNDDGRRRVVARCTSWEAADELAGRMRDGSSESEVEAGWNYLPIKFAASNRDRTNEDGDPPTEGVMRAATLTTGRGRRRKASMLKSRPTSDGQTRSIP